MYIVGIQAGHGRYDKQYQGDDEGGATAQLVAERADNHLPCGQPQHAECEGELYQRGGRVEIVDELGKCRQVEIGDKGTECRQHAHEE